MRVLPALSALLIAVLAGCSEPAPPLSAPAPSESAPSGSAPASSAPAAAAGAPEGRCHTDQLSARLDAPASRGDSQVPVKLVYTNKSQRPCLLRGVPGADLHGPADPNGPVYTLTRQTNGVKDIHLRPGASASARLVVLPYSDGSVGSMGSTRWVPTRLETIPPGETTPLTAQWPAGLTVLRQDSATHPGSWIEPFAAG